MSTHFPLLGILGAGQLGRMLALAAIPMGIRVRFLSPGPSGPMEGLGENMIGNWEDPTVLKEFVDGCDGVTVESEWAPLDRIEALGLEDLPLWPSPRTLHTIRHKGRQNDALARAGLPLPAFHLCATLEEALQAATRFGFPCIAKRYEGSYDGYGNATIESESDLSRAWDELASDDGLLIESWAPFVRELSVIVVRSAAGDVDAYPVAFTEQRDHRSHAVVVPAGIDPGVEQLARDTAIAAVEVVDGVGVTGVELFEMEDGSILVNELAPRPHNTGHYTIEACHTSQFENHVRAVLGLPLGDCSMRVPAACMVNVLGRRNGSVSFDDIPEVLRAFPAAHFHMYGKSDVRMKRKMGHVTVTGSDPAEVRATAERAAAGITL